MVRHQAGHAGGAEIDRLEAVETFAPVAWHHLAVLEVILAVGPLHGCQFERDVELAGGSFKHAHPFRHDFVANAVAGDDGDFMDFHRETFSDSKE